MPKKILIIDDDKNITDLLSSRVQAAGYKAIMANSGSGGLNLARTKNPDLIILDVMMPDTDGYQLCLLFKADERLKKVPIIMLTGMNDRIDIVTGKAVGADEYVTKPFDSSKLLEIISKLLNEKAAQ